MAGTDHKFIAGAMSAGAIMLGCANAAAIALHVDDNCEGPALSTTVSDEDVNYPVSSVKVFDGDWEICRNSNYANCVAIEKAGCFNLEDVQFWGQVRSVKLSEEAAARAEAIFYRDVEFSGPAVFTAKAYEKWDGFPIRSFRVKSGRWEICSKENFRGDCKTLSVSAPHLGAIGMAERVKSIRPLSADAPEQAKGAAAFHAHRGCDGPAYSTTRAVADMNYPVRSVRVHSGEWEFCSQENYQGSCKRVSETCTNVRDAGFWGQVRSARPVGPEKQPR